MKFHFIGLHWFCRELSARDAQARLPWDVHWTLPQRCPQTPRVRSRALEATHTIRLSNSLFLRRVVKDASEGGAKDRIGVDVPREIWLIQAMAALGGSHDPIRKVPTASLIAIAVGSKLESCH